MAENLSKKPSKSILKNSSSFDTPDARKQPNKKPLPKGTKWDEMNIMETLHPPGKDYGFMKIDEPKTPYNFEGLGVDAESLDAETLAAKIREQGNELPKAMQESSGEDEDEETPEEKQARKEFEMKRKKHYNEYYAVKLARKLLEKDEDDEDDSNDGSEKSQPKSPCCKAPEERKIYCTAPGCKKRQAAKEKKEAGKAAPCTTSRNCKCTEMLRKILNGAVNIVEVVRRHKRYGFFKRKRKENFKTDDH